MELSVEVDHQPCQDEAYKLELHGAWEPLGKVPKLYFYILQKTKLSSRRMQVIKFKLGFDCCLAVVSEGRSSKLTRC